MKIERINDWFALRGRWLVQKRWIVLGSFVLFLAIGFMGLKFFKVSASWEDYFLEDDPILVKTEEFKEIFGNDNFAAVLTRCDNSFTKENLELIRELTNEMMDSLSYADKITSLTDIEFMMGRETGIAIEQIVPDTIPSDPKLLEEIRRKAYLKPHIAERLVSKDGRLSWIVLKLRTFPEESVWNKGKNAISPEMLTGNELEHIITKEKYQKLHPKGTGLPYVTSMKMKWIEKEMPRVMGIAAIVSIFILLVITRSFRGVMIPLITAVSSIIIVYGMLGYIGMTIDSSMMMIPMLLTFAVSIAYNVHIYTYFKRQFLIHGKRKYAVEETVREMGWPILFSALTTFVALLSFLAIPMQPMRFIGIATSSCVMLAFFIAITLMPICLSFGKDGTPHLQIQETGGRWLDRKLEKLGGSVLKYGTFILCLAGVVTIVFIYQLLKIETAFDVERTMGRKIAYVNRLLEVGESELGSIYTYDVMIDLPQKGLAKSPEILLRLDSLARHANRYKLTKRTTTVLNILKDLNQTLHDGDASYYTIPQNSDEVAQLLLLYENAGGSEVEYWIDYDYQRLRLMVEMNSYDSAETERELKDIVNQATKLFPQATVTTVGSIPQFTVMMQYVARGQIISFAISLFIIGILMMLVFGSVRIGLIGLIPNITPALVVGGLMGWLGYPLDMMTATIMPMILGLAVDDTIHFINHGHLEFDRQGNYRDAILRSFRTIGTPIVLTSVVICANFAIYTTSESLSFIHMGILSVVGIASALLADLCITPILFQKCRLFGKEIHTDKTWIK
ncbi:MAG: MMPL family transporter [Phocaeicola sp.]|nr:MMPL family transporter [Phocaeicola sp.]MDD7447844.1 MMPL family transporter [Prevotellaceae bacterium]MDY3913648.1 MMPL family transporter [Phocaeicola sp.]MDY5938336.1 MMPL family transporter [Phocaeicola sp.]